MTSLGWFGKASGKHVEWCPGRGKCGLLCLGCINNYLNNYFSWLVPFLFIEKQLESRHCCSPGWTAANFLCNRIRKQNSLASCSLPAMQHKKTHKGKPDDIFYISTAAQEMFFLSIQGRKKVWQMDWKVQRFWSFAQPRISCPTFLKAALLPGLYHASVTAWEILQQIIPTPPFFLIVSFLQGSCCIIWKNKPNEVLSHRQMNLFREISHRKQR